MRFSKKSFCYQTKLGSHHSMPNKASHWHRILWRKVQHFLQGTRQGELAAHVLEIWTLKEEVLKGSISVGVEGNVVSSWTFFWSVVNKFTGWYFWNLSHQLSHYIQSGVFVLWLACSHHPPTWVGVLISAEQLKDMGQIVRSIPWEGTVAMFKLLMLFFYFLSF